MCAQVFALAWGSGQTSPSNVCIDGPQLLSKFMCLAMFGHVSHCMDANLAELSALLLEDRGCLYIYIKFLNLVNTSSPGQPGPP